MKVFILDESVMAFVVIFLMAQESNLLMSQSSKEHFEKKNLHNLLGLVFIFNVEIL
jgi:hypothetical protein